MSDWLFEDAQEKKKQRRTNLQLFRELQAHHFPGSYRTLPRNGEYSTTAKKKTRVGTMEHPADEVQVDFGVMEAVEE